MTRRTKTKHITRTGILSISLLATVLFSIVLIRCLQAPLHLNLFRAAHWHYWHPFSLLDVIVSNFDLIRTTSGLFNIAVFNTIFTIQHILLAVKPNINYLISVNVFFILLARRLTIVTLLKKLLAAGNNTFNVFYQYLFTHFGLRNHQHFYLQISTATVPLP